MIILIRDTLTMKINKKIIIALLHRFWNEDPADELFAEELMKLIAKPRTTHEKKEIEYRVTDGRT